MRCYAAFPIPALHPVSSLRAPRVCSVRHLQALQTGDKFRRPNDPLAGHASKQPDKELFDKALIAMKKGKFDVARLDLQTLLNTYPESEYQMRAKLLVGDSWFKEGGTAALTQAEAEYKDFITFFPNTAGSRRSADEGRRHLLHADGKT